MAMAVTIDSLPTELLTQVFTHLAGPPPSSSRLHDQPADNMLANRELNSVPLKITSLVCRRWRSTVLPILFQHAIWSFNRWDLLHLEHELADPPTAVASVPCPDETAVAIPLFAFLRTTNLAHYVDTLTLIVNDSNAGMYKLRETAPGLDNSAFIHAENNANSLPIGAARIAQMHLADAPTRPGREREATYNEDNNWLWRALFAVVDPRRFTIIASPRMLASLLSRMLFLGDAWSFQMPRHILSLGRADRSRDGADSGHESKTTAARSSPSSSRPDTRPGYKHKRVPCALFTIRPWTTLLLNEGSSTRVYKTYEFFLKRPPSILGALLGSEEFPNDVPLVPRSVRDMSYVGIFPLSSHFNTLVQHLPRLDRLFVQLVPRNDILHDRDEMRNIDQGDLWMERNTSYSLLMRELLDGEPGFGGEAHPDWENENGNDADDGGEPRQGINWRYLREFESGDAADREAWEMAVEYVKVAGLGWEVERDGVFIKKDRKAQRNTDMDEAGPQDDTILDGDVLDDLAEAASPENDSDGDKEGEDAALDT